MFSLPDLTTDFTSILQFHTSESATPLKNGFSKRSTGTNGVCKSSLHSDNDSVTPVGSSSQMSDPTSSSASPSFGNKDSDHPKGAGSKRCVFPPLETI